MKIWLINPYGPIPTEAWRIYCYPLIANALREEGHEVIWWTSNFAHHFKKWRSDGWKDLSITEGFTIRLVPTTGYKKNISFGRFFRDAIFAFKVYKNGKKEAAPDCIISSESPLTFGYASFKLAKHHCCPVVYHQMDLWPELIINSFPVFFRPIVNLLFSPVFYSRKKVYSKLDGSSALAKSYLEEIFKVNPKLMHKPHAVVYNGIDINKFRTKLKNNNYSLLPSKHNSDIWAVFAGSLGPSYDLDTLCDAAKVLKEQSSNIKIIIAGDGPRREYIKRISNDDDYNLHYVGQLSSDNLASLYAQADIGLCAYSSNSNVEMPDKIYDYTASGLAVLVSLQGEVKNIVLDNCIGYSYEPGNLSDFLLKLKLMTNSSDQLEAMKALSWDLGAEYDAKSQYRKMVALVEAVCQKRGL